MVPEKSLRVWTLIKVHHSALLHMVILMLIFKYPDGYFLRII